VCFVFVKVISVIDWLNVTASFHYKKNAINRRCKLIFHLDYFVEFNAAFTHAELTTRYRKESLLKSVFLFSSQAYAIFCVVKRIESLLHTASKKFEFKNLESLFHKQGSVPGRQNRTRHKVNVFLGKKWPQIQQLHNECGSLPFRSFF